MVNAKTSIIFVTGALYFMLGNIDPSLRSRVDIIQLVALFHYHLLETYSFDRILVPFVSDLQSLSSVSDYAVITQNTSYMYVLCVSARFVCAS